MKIICNNKVIDLDKFDTVTCRESLAGKGFPIEAVRKEAGGFFGGIEITEEICRMTKMEYAEAVLKKITESWINEEAFISIDEVIKNLQEVKQQLMEGIN